MKSADRKVMKDIAKHRDLEMNIPAYGNAVAAACPTLEEARFAPIFLAV